MALAIRLDHLLDTGVFQGQADIARTAGLTRARVTQILNLTNLAPDIQEDIQEDILNFEPTAGSKSKFKENSIRRIATDPNWNKQRKAWHRMKRLAEQS